VASHKRSHPRCESSSASSTSAMSAWYSARAFEGGREAGDFAVADPLPFFDVFAVLVVTDAAFFFAGFIANEHRSMIADGQGAHTSLRRAMPYRGANVSRPVAARDDSRGAGIDGCTVAHRHALASRP
jgi:hypothetical protein